MASKLRGRPKSSSPHYAADREKLRSAASMMLFQGVKTPTEAFKRLTQDESVLRRLQRRWKRDGEAYLNHYKDQTRLWNDRWAHEAKALEHSAPDLFAKVKEFGESAEGKAILQFYGDAGKPAVLMSLGIVKLWELIQETSPIGAVPADKAFDKTYASWSRYGLEPDSAFLTRMAELCLAKAADARASLGNLTPAFTSGPTSGAEDGQDD